MKRPHDDLVTDCDEDGQPPQQVAKLLIKDEVEAAEAAAADAAASEKALA